MKLIPFNCVNPKTGDELVFYINPDQVAFVSGGTLPGEVVSFPSGEPTPVEAAAIILQNGIEFTVKDTVENVIKRLKGK